MISENWGIIKKPPTLSDNLIFPNPPFDKEKAVHLLIILINQANYLIDNLFPHYKDKHIKEGKLPDKLYFVKNFRDY